MFAYFVRQKRRLKKPPIAGGDAIDITDKLHPTWTKLAIKITRDMNLCYAGMDIISYTPLAFTQDDQYVVLKINATPGLDKLRGSWTPTSGKVESLYEKIVKATIKPH